MESKTLCANLLQAMAGISQQQQPSDSILFVPPQPPYLSSLFNTVVWQGDVFYNSQPVTCNITSRLTSKEKFCADKLPLSPEMHMFYQHESQEFAEFILMDPHSMVIQISIECKAALYSLMRPGMVGAIVFSSVCIKACYNLYFVWLQDKQMFFGLFLEDAVQNYNKQMELLKPVVDSPHNQMNSSNQQQVSEVSRLQQQFKVLHQALARVHHSRYRPPISDQNFAAHLKRFVANRRRYRMHHPMASPYSIVYQPLSLCQDIMNVPKTYTRRRLITRKPIVPLSQEINFNCPTINGSARSQFRKILMELREPKSAGASVNNEAIEELMSKMKNCTVLNSLESSGASAKKREDGITDVSSGEVWNSLDK